MSKADYYDILQLQRNCTLDDIKKSYRKLAMEYHPDKNQDDITAEEKFKEISEAYEVLSNENSRAKYDRFGHNNPQVNFNGWSNINNTFTSDFFNHFSNFHRHQHNQINGEDIQIKLQVTLEEISNGSAKKIQYNRLKKCVSCNGIGTSDPLNIKTCTNCNGSGRVQRVSGNAYSKIINIEMCNICSGSGNVITNPCSACNGQKRTIFSETLNINIPFGVVTGNYTGITGGGNSGLNGGSNGNLILIFEEIKHKYFKRSGNDIIYEHIISYPDLLLGTEIDIPTLLDSYKVHIPSGTQIDKYIIVKNKGIRYSEILYGNLLIKLNVYIPKTISDSEKLLLIELKNHQKI